MTGLPTKKRKARSRLKALARGIRRTKKHVRKGRRKPIPWMAIVLVIASLTGGFLLARWTLVPPPKPPTRPSLSQQIHLMGLALKSQLYSLGISDDNLIDRKTEIRKEGDNQWTCTTSRIQLPRPIPFAEITRQLSQEIGTLGTEYRVVAKRDQEDVLELQLRIRDLVAYDLLFYPPKVVTPKPPAPLPPEIPPGLPPEARIAIVIDDLGQDRRIAMEFLDLDIPLSFSIFPFAPFSQDIAREATQRGRDVLLHLPMEPREYPGRNPGKGVLLTTMDKERLLAQLEKDLSAVPYVKGVNNHMGSRFTEDPDLMRLVLEDLKKRNLFFLDSLTTNHSAGLKVSRELGVKAMQRNVFLDNDRDTAKIKARIHELIRIARKNGGAIGIGHPHPETIQAIREVLPSFKENRIELIPVSSLLGQQTHAETPAEEEPQQ